MTSFDKVHWVPLKLEEVEIGMEICYHDTSAKYKGTITKIQDNNVTGKKQIKVVFDEQPLKGYPKSFFQKYRLMEYTFNLSERDLVFNSVSKYVFMSKEQRIANKCKNLWNKSQWVKKNPHLAY